MPCHGDSPLQVPFRTGTVASGCRRLVHNTCWPFVRNAQGASEAVSSSVLLDNGPNRIWCLGHTHDELWRAL